MVITVCLLLATCCLVALYLLLKYQHSYWEKKNIPFVKPCLLAGNIKNMITMKQSPADIFYNLYNHESVRNHKAFGMYMLNKPALVVRDPEMAKTIFVTEFKRFANRYATADPHGDPLAANNLFFSKYAHWKVMRPKMSPIFSSGKLKQMFLPIDEIGYELDEYLCGMTKGKKTCMHEVKEISACYATDVIIATSYGVRANSLKDRNCAFRRNGKPLFDGSTKRSLEMIVIFFVPHIVKLVKAKVFPTQAATFLRKVINFSIYERVKSGIVRSALIEVLTMLKKAGKAEGVYVNDKVVSQGAVFFSAGFESSSSVITFAMFELSKNSGVQKKLREEIRQSLIKSDGKITYESLHEMQYLDMVVNEVLRLYPPQPFIDRECTLLDGEKEFSLKPHIDFDIPNGMAVYYPVFATQRDPKYFPNPEEFNPERFSRENKHKIEPLAFLPFGFGPHRCIGERLGIIQTKMGIVNFLRSHYAEPSHKSLKEIQIDPKAVLLNAKGGVYINLVRNPLFVKN